MTALNAAFWIGLCSTATTFVGLLTPKPVKEKIQNALETFTLRISYYDTSWLYQRLRAPLGRLLLGIITFQLSWIFTLLVSMRSILDFYDLVNARNFVMTVM